MSAQPDLTFHAGTHSYYVKGVPVPSVTQILQPIIDYSRVPEHVLEYARQLGTAIHLACALDDADDLDEASVAEEIRPYLEAWRLFKLETGFVPEFIEKPLYSQIHHYAGTFDRVGLMRGILGKPRALIEIKSTADFMPSFGPQLAGYWQLLRESKLMDTRQLLATRRYAVQLRDNGTYRLERYADHQDMADFLACLTLLRHKERNK